MNAKEQRLKHELNYIKFLETRLNSSNYKKNVSEEEYKKTEAKLKKAKLVLNFINLIYTSHK